MRAEGSNHPVLIKKDTQTATRLCCCFYCRCRCYPILSVTYYGASDRLHDVNNNSNTSSTEKGTMLIPQLPGQAPAPALHGVPFPPQATTASPVGGGVLPLQRSTAASPWAVVHHHAARRRVFAEYDAKQHHHFSNNNDNIGNNNINSHSSDHDDDDDVWQGWERLLHWKDGAYKIKNVDSNNNNSNDSRRHHHRYRHLQASSSSSGGSSSSSSMPLSNCHSLLYTTNIEIGNNTPSPSQSFQVQLDLEGTDLWVLSADCDDSCAGIAGGVGYDATASETSKPLHDNDDDDDDNMYETGARSGNQVRTESVSTKPKGCVKLR